MKTIRMTAISTEKARSRTQESALQMLVRTDETARASAGPGVGVRFSGIICYVIIDVLSGGSVAGPYFKRELSAGMVTAPSLRGSEEHTSELQSRQYLECR